MWDLPGCSGLGATGKIVLPGLSGSDLYFNCLGAVGCCLAAPVHNLICAQMGSRRQTGGIGEFQIDPKGSVICGLWTDRSNDGGLFVIL